MNDEKQVVKLAAERLLAVANGATLEWTKTGDELNFPWNVQVGAIGGDMVRIRPPAVAPEPKPSQAVLGACKRLGVEAWKLDRFVKGDRILGNGYVSERDGDTYGQACSPIMWTADKDQDPAHTSRYWHVRPIAATLPCPPKPTPEQVAAARMPDGRRVKEPTVCEVPNGRAWFAASSPRVYAGSKVPASEYGQRRWIAEPADEVVEPWTFATIPRPFPALHRWGGEYEIVAANTMVFVTIGGRGEGWGIVSHDWREMADFAQHNGQPCGVAK